MRHPWRPRWPWRCRSDRCAWLLCGRNRFVVLPTCAGSDKAPAIEMRRPWDLNDPAPASSRIPTLRYQVLRHRSRLRHNPALNCTGARHSGLQSRGRAPMLVGGWRGRSVPMWRPPVKARSLGSGNRRLRCTTCPGHVEFTKWHLVDATIHLQDVWWCPVCSRRFCSLLS